MADFTFPERAKSEVVTVGKDYLIYVNTGTTETPVWTLLGGQRSGGLTREADEIDASHKTSGGWALTVPGLKSWSTDLELVYLMGDTGAKFIEAAFLAGKEIFIKYEYPDGSYYTGWCSITSCSLDTPHDDVATLSGTLKGTSPLSDLITPEA